MKKIIILVYLLFWAGLCQADKYWIYFTDKGTQSLSISNVSGQTIKNRQKLNLPLLQFSDVPVYFTYLDSLKTLEIKAICQSKWLNAISAELAPWQIERLQNISFVQRIEKINSRTLFATAGNDSLVTYDFVLQQINAKAITEAGLSGNGVAIGILDGGFLDAPENKLLKHIFNKRRYVLARDFVNPAKENLFKGAESSIDWHGTSVWTNIAGFDSTDQIKYGLATDATFYLARTDHGRDEFREEEDYWVAALEWMDSLGVRLVNSSLGYSIDFDDPEENYQVHEMDGETSTVAQAATIAVNKKGMLIVASAGNEGNVASWQVVSTPADAKGVLAVGATDSNGRKTNYSAIGPEFLPYIKPDVACYSSFGTSFSAPVITGLAACLLQYNDSLSNFQIIEIIKKSAHLRAKPNNYLGYGIPDANMIMANLRHKQLQKDEVEEIIVKKNTIDLQHDSNKVVVFHKTADQWVKGQELLYKNEDKDYFQIKNIAKARQSTVTDGKKVWEIIWQQQEN
ncbi:MAG: S8 family serine peptidase [Cyclobacteriaceae bacterium]